VEVAEPYLLAIVVGLSVGASLAATSVPLIVPSSLHTHTPHLKNLLFLALSSLIFTDKDTVCAAITCFVKALEEINCLHSSDSGSVPVLVIETVLLPVLDLTSEHGSLPTPVQVVVSSQPP